MTSILRLNSSTPFLQNVPNSLVSTEWLRLLSSIIQVLGNGSDLVDIADFEEFVLTSRSPDNKALELSDLRDFQESASSRKDDAGYVIEELQNLQQSNNALRGLINSLSVKLDELERLSLAGRTASGSISSAASSVSNESTSATYYPVFVTGTAGSYSLGASTSNFKFNPSTGLLTCTSLSLSGSEVINANSAAAPTAVSGSLLQIVGADSLSPNIEVDSFASNGTLLFRRANGTGALPSALASGDIIFRVVGRGYGATGYSSTLRCGMSGVAAEAYDDSNQGSRLVWAVTPTGSTTGATAMTLEANGNFRVNSASVPAANLHFGGSFSAISWTTNGVGLRCDAATYTNSSTAASGTAATGHINTFAAPTIAATNATVTVTDAATVYISGAPIAGTNVTLTRAWAMLLAAGQVGFGGNVRMGGTTAPTVACDVTGAVQATTSIKSIGATSGIGYGVGAGSTVSQSTNKSTGVTLNNVTGQITLNNAALAANTTVSFTLTNSAIAADDVVAVNRKSGGTAAAYQVWCDSVAAGSCVICVRNTTAGSLSEAVVLQFSVTKGAIS